MHVLFCVTYPARPPRPGVLCPFVDVEIARGGASEIPRARGLVSCVIVSEQTSRENLEFGIIDIALFPNRVQRLFMARALLTIILALLVSGPETGKLKWGKLKRVTESVSFSCQDPTKCQKRQLSVSFPSAFCLTRFRLPVSGPLTFGALSAEVSRRAAEAFASWWGRRK